MPEVLRLSVGRIRKTVAIQPSEGGYISSIRNQMNLIKGNLLKVVNHIENVTPSALRFGLQPIFDESQRLVPVDTGDLKASGFIEVRTTGSGVTSAAIGYGRFGKPFYAGFVHERLDLRHASPTQAKFLEAAVNTKINTFKRRVALFYQKQTGLKI